MRGKKIRTMAVTLVMAAFAAGVLLSGYSYAEEGGNPGEADHAIIVLESVRQNYLASVRLEALKSKSTMPVRSHADNPSHVWLKRVMPSQVNMVTNMYTQDSQSAVQMGGKLYYTNSEPYIMNLRENPSIRFSKDPVTGMTIDKAEAAIYIDASGRALYFKSDDTFRNFIALAEKDTLFGYTTPKQ